MISAAKANKDYFRKAYLTGEHGWEAEPNPYVLRYLERLEKTQPGAELLDLGCGEGRHAIAAGRLGFRVTAADSEPAALQRAKSKARAAGVAGVRFLKADVLALPSALTRNNFYIVLDFGCLHHQRKADWPAYMRSLLRALKPGGYLILSVFSPRFRFFSGTTRNWHIARGAYRRCFSKKDLSGFFNKEFTSLNLQEDPDGFLHALLRRREANS